MYNGDICICGGKSYPYDNMICEGVYCCNPPDEICEVEDFGTGYNLICKNGTAKHVDEICNDQCPYSQGKN